MQGLQLIQEELQEVTDCNEEFVKVLQDFGALGINDVTELNTRRERYGPQEQTQRLYQILLTRDHDTVKSILIHAYSKTNQMAAVKLLISGKSSKNQMSTNSKAASHSISRKRIQTITEEQKIEVNEEIFTYHEKQEHVVESLDLLTKGKYQGRVVAVKRISFRDKVINQNDLLKANELLKIAKHRNVLPFLQIQQHVLKDEEVLLFARDILQYSLEDWISTNGTCTLPAVIKPLEIMEGVTKGLDYLHSNGIIHTNIKPQNILFKKHTRKNGVLVKLADFNLIKNITEDGSLILGDGWIAPEILDNVLITDGNAQSETQTRITWTYAADIFSLGYVFYYILSGGQLPFTIVNGRVRRERKIEFGDEFLRSKQGSTHLIRLMTALNPTERPPAHAILSYHIFLPMEEKLHFLQSVHTCLTTKSKLAKIRQCKDEINSYAEKIWTPTENGWRNSLCPTLQNYTTTKRMWSKEIFNSVYELVNFMITIYNERDTLDKSMRSAVGTDDAKFMTYWKTRFPFIIHYVWLVFQKIKDEPSHQLLKYYPSSPNDYVFTQMITCDKISYDPSSILGRGYGTAVFKGQFDSREVAIKRIDRKLCRVANPIDEINMLLLCDKHENVVKYYVQEQDDLHDVILIALELCDVNLEDWVNSHGKCIPNMKNVINPRNILFQVTRGLAHLHEKGVVHRDLKPENILLQVISKNKTLIKISDFGISKLLPEGKSAATRKTSSGSIEWMATEIREKSSWKMTTATDIFVAGCIYYYVITWGGHPFRSPQNPNPIRTQCNISEYKPCLNLQGDTSLPSSYLGDVRLIQRMISNDPASRPTAAAILKHHIFWSKQTCIDFIFAVSNVIKVYEKICNTTQTTNALRQCMTQANDNYSRGLYINWVTRLTPEVQKFVNANQFRGYETTSVLGLLPAIRNLAEHYDKQPQWIRDELGKSTDLYDYWQVRFPFLIDNVWANFEKLKDEEVWKLRRYYCDTYNFDYYHTDDDLTVYSKYVEWKLKQPSNSKHDIVRHQPQNSRAEYGMFSSQWCSK